VIVHVMDHVIAYGDFTVKLGLGGAFSILKRSSVYSEFIGKRLHINPRAADTSFFLEVIVEVHAYQCISMLHFLFRFRVASLAASLSKRSDSSASFHRAPLTVRSLCKRDPAGLNSDG